MKLIHKLKQFEKAIVFMRWANNAEYGKIKYVGHDFVEFEIIDPETVDYTESVLINPNLILEIVIRSPDINRVIAEISCNLPPTKDKK